MLVSESNKKRKNNSIQFNLIAIHRFILKVNLLNTGNEGGLTQDMSPRGESHFLKKHIL